MAISIIYLWLKPDGLSSTNSEVINAFWLNALQFNPMARLPEFMMGMACGFLFLRSRKNDKLAISLIATGIAGFILVVRCGNWIPYPVLHTALLAPAFAAIVYGVALRPRFSNFLENKTLVLLGDSSYSLYLLHTIVIGAFFQFSKTGFENPTVLKTVAAVTVAVLVSVGVYRWIEVPGLRMLRPKDKRKPGIRAAARICANSGSSSGSGSNATRSVAPLPLPFGLSKRRVEKHRCHLSSPGRIISLVKPPLKSGGRHPNYWDSRVGLLRWNEILR